MSQEKESYRQIFKATSIFGGVQVLNILISIIRQKAIAMLLGPAGMGISGLFLSTTQLIAGFTTFGLGTSAIRDISVANESGDLSKVSKVITIFRRLVWITGLLGLVITLAFARQLSEFSFGNANYTNAFRWLSVTLLFNQLTSGQNVLMQGMRQLRSLALANVIGSAVGLVLSLPLYYLYRFEGIVPAMIISSILAMGIEYYFSSKIKIPRAAVSSEETKTVARSMLVMGIMLSISGVITVASSYLIRIGISRLGNVDDVGFYTAGFNIINSYVGLVFAAMSTDYFPRLSGVAHDSEKLRNSVNQQAVLSILILGPILILFIVFIHFILMLLYDVRFTVIDQMMRWAALGIFFKAASWAVSFIFLAKGVNKTYFWNELLINIYLLVFSVVFYKYLGTKGLGIAFLLSYALYFLQAYLFANKLFGLKLHSDFLKVFSLQAGLSIIAFALFHILDGYTAILVAVIPAALSVFLSFKTMNEKMQVVTAIKNKFKR